MKQSKEASSGLLCLKDSLQEQLYLRARYWLSSVIRDDVFFAPSFTMYSGAISALAAPCLPPVTPPSDLLVDQEPLFEGIVDLSTEEVSVRRPEKRPGAIMSLKIKKRKHTKPNTKTRFEQLTLKGGVWCRYCGVTEDVNWRPGPWGKKTLCNKHGCDYKGYGLASRIPRLDLSAYVGETLKDRIIPVVLQVCFRCQSLNKGEIIITCQGCTHVFHQHCGRVEFNGKNYCSPNCIKKNLTKSPLVNP